VCNITGGQTTKTTALAQISLGLRGSTPTVVTARRR